MGEFAQDALPGMPAELVNRKSSWREHTAERWRARDEEAVAECLHLIRCGAEVNQTRLAERFGVSPNTIHALMMEVFSVEELQAINAKAAAIASMQAVAKMTEVMPAAKVKDLGALAMAGKQTFDMAQLGSGGPTEIRREEHVLRVEDFEREAFGEPVDAGEAAEGAGMGLEGGNVLALGEGAAGDLVRPVIEAEVVERASGSLPPHEGNAMGSCSAMCAVVMVAFMMIKGEAAEGPLAPGNLTRGGGGLPPRAPSHLYIPSGTEKFSAMGA